MAFFLLDSSCIKKIVCKLSCVIRIIYNRDGLVCRMLKLGLIALIKNRMFENLQYLMRILGYLQQNLSQFRVKKLTRLLPINLSRYESADRWIITKLKAGIALITQLRLHLNDNNKRKNDRRLTKKLMMRLRPSIELKSSSSTDRVAIKSWICNE